MTTARSPLRVIKAHADRIAKELKNIAGTDVPSAGIRFAVVMDDKTLIIEMSWATIKDTSEAGIAEYILRYMRDARDKGN